MASLENINQEILIEVLSQLPIKNLFQLRCVSKQWHDLLFQASRKLATTTTTTLPASGLFYHQNSNYSYARLLDDTDDYDGLFDIDLGFMPCGSSDLRILDSRNGLLLCLPKTGPQPTLHLCNPMTKTWSRYFQVIHYTNLSSTLDVAVFNSGNGRWVEKSVGRTPTTTDAQRLRRRSSTRAAPAATSRGEARRRDGGAWDDRVARIRIRGIGRGFGGIGRARSLREPRRTRAHGVGAEGEERVG
ncbi:F-box protein [Acorus calamus]|uniref:F-box protein n=1 Tax=Acorus calamus TaxID=4465 RepID=A0AAV9FLG9_ACOCL|nr:F-box protein [Acorus calamus]